MKVDKLQMKMVMLKQGYDEHEVTLSLDHYPEDIDDRFSESYSKYLEDQSILDVEFDGVSLSKIIKLCGLHFFMALNDFSKFMSTAEGSEDRAKWKKILTTPVHFE